MYEKLAVLNDDDYHHSGVSLEDYTFYEYFPFGNLHLKNSKIQIHNNAIHAMSHLQ